jgi:hypothetical protein
LGQLMGWSTTETLEACGGPGRVELQSRLKGRSSSQVCGRQTKMAVGSILRFRNRYRKVSLRDRPVYRDKGKARRGFLLLREPVPNWRKRSGMQYSVGFAELVSP